MGFQPMLAVVRLDREKLLRWYRRNAFELAVLAFVSTQIYLSSGHSGRQSRWDKVVDTYGQFVVLALWIAAIPAIIAAVSDFAAKRRYARRLAGGLCPDCGYDLRASTNRCPECGRPIIQPP